MNVLARGLTYCFKLIFIRNCDNIVNMLAARTLDFLVLCNITKRVLYFTEIVVRETQAILREKVSELVNNNNNNNNSIFL